MVKFRLEKEDQLHASSFGCDKDMARCPSLVKRRGDPKVMAAMCEPELHADQRMRGSCGQAWFGSGADK